MNEPSGTPTKSDASWSFDLKNLHAHLDNDDELNVILRGHLYLEHVLIEFLKEALEKPNEIDIKRILYPMKVDLCAALGILEKELVGAMNKVNEFRNRAAHRLDYKITAQDKKDLFNCLPKMGKELALENGQPDKSFTLDQVSLGHIFKVLVVLLDLNRQSYIAWKNKRRDAFDNAKKVLESVQESIKKP